MRIASPRVALRIAVGSIASTGCSARSGPVVDVAPADAVADPWAMLAVFGGLVAVGSGWAIVLLGARHLAEANLGRGTPGHPPPEDRVRRMARRLRLVATGAALTGLIVTHGLSVGYHLRLFAGETVVGTFDAMHAERFEPADRQEPTRDTLWFRVTMDDGTPLRRKVSPGSLPDLVRPGDPIYVRHVPGATWASELGSEPTLHDAPVSLHVLHGGAWLALALLTLVLAISRRLPGPTPRG